MLNFHNNNWTWNYLIFSRNPNLKYKESKNIFDISKNYYIFLTSGNVNFWLINSLFLIVLLFIVDLLQYFSMKSFT